MELDRPHHDRTRSNNNELFPSRLSSSSSMKMSKSIVSPGRSRDQSMAMSLPTSLSRRLRTNGSIKGQASPMFPSTTNKKRGCGGYENPEPSSPKVTCIGQVRVKSKKKAKTRRRSNGEVSFRRLDDGFTLKCEDKLSQPQRFNQQGVPGRNQRWVHLPLTICEALKAFGAEFSCLFPCSSSWCFSTSASASASGNGREKEEKGNGGSCGAVFVRWLVTLQDGEGGKEREIELVVGGEDHHDDNDDEDMMMMTTTSTRRRHVLEDFEVKGDDEKKEQVEEKVEEGRVSVCVPPKNALLLMRCRSDPVKMAALTNRFWEPPPLFPLPKDEEDEVDLDKAVDVQLQCPKQDLDAVPIPFIVEEIAQDKHQINEELDDSSSKEELVQDDGNEQLVQEEVIELPEEEEEEEEEEEQESNQIEDESFSSSLSSDREEMEAIQVILLAIETALHEEINAEIESNIDTETEFEETTMPQLVIQTEDTENNGDEEVEVEERKLSMEEETSSVLPDCLLLMMCEPKLSMEVSKETWVCSTDFVRCLPQKKKLKKPLEEVKKEGMKESNTKKRVSFESKCSLLPPRHPQLAVPPRSSCTLPAAAAVSMAAMIEQKLVNGVGYEPFVLTRCKSEPMRSAAAKLAAPDSCFWTKRKLEPLRRAAYQVGATGVGF